MSEKKCFTEVRFFKWKEDEVSVSLRAESASYGGGSEVFVICPTAKQSAHCAPQTINGFSKSKSCKGNSSSK